MKKIIAAVVVCPLVFVWIYTIVIVLTTYHAQFGVWWGTP